MIGLLYRQDCVCVVYINMVYRLVPMMKISAHKSSYVTVALVF